MAGVVEDADEGKQRTRRTENLHLAKVEEKGEKEKRRKFDKFIVTIEAAHCCFYRHPTWNFRDRRAAL